MGRQNKFYDYVVKEIMDNSSFISSAEEGKITLIIRYNAGNRNPYNPSSYDGWGLNERWIKTILGEIDTVPRVYADDIKRCFPYLTTDDCIIIVRKILIKVYDKLYKEERRAVIS
jgi:hypothetical protein